MTIIKILELYNQAKLTEYDIFRSTDSNYYDLIYLLNELHFIDEEDQTHILTFTDIADLMNDNVIFIKDGNVDE